VVSLGGAGSLNDLGAGILAGASATAAGSMFVFQDKQRSVLINYPSEKELDVFSEALRGGI
jgi:cyclase